MTRAIYLPAEDPATHAQTCLGHTAVAFAGLLAPEAFPVAAELIERLAAMAEVPAPPRPVLTVVPDPPSDHPFDL